MLKKRGIKKQPQEQIFKDLKESIELHQKKGSEILICIDANEQWEEGSAIQDFSLSLGLTDIAREKFDENYPPTFTRQNTQRRIDFMLGSEEVIKNVVAYGMAPLSMGRSIGDHRAQYVDINVLELLQMNTHDLSTPSSRRLKSPDPKCVTKYTKCLQDHLIDHRVFQRAEDLINNLKEKNHMTPEDKKEYEQLDEDIFRLCKSSENEIKLSKFQKHVWSPALDTAYKVANYWRLREEKIKNTTKTKQILKLSKALGLNDDNSKNINEIKKLRNSAFKFLHKIRLQAKEKRIEFLYGLAEKYALENNMTNEKAILAILSHEEIRELYRHIRFKLQGSRQPSLSEVWIKNGDGEKTILTESKDVESHLLQRNKDHLQQASNTLFADGPLGEMIQWDGSGELADRLVNGDPLPDMRHLDSTIQSFLEGMAASKLEMIDSVKISLTTKEYREFWKKT